MSSTTILQLTDLHVFADPAARLKGIPTRELLHDVTEHIKASERSFDHLIVTGDHTHDELPESYNAVRQLLSPWIDQLLQVPGNHDDRAVLRSVFSDRVTGEGPEKINFSFQASGWLCLGLDTHVPGEVFGRIGTEQVDWIWQQLGAYQPVRVALFMHHPPIELNSVWMDRIGLLDRELLHRCMEQNPSIQLVCCGHVHHESIHRMANATVVTTPSTGLQFSPDGDEPTFVAAAPGYRIIELNESGFQTEVIRLPEIRFEPTS